MVTERPSLGGRYSKSKGGWKRRRKQQRGRRRSCQGGGRTRRKGVPEARERKCVSRREGKAPPSNLAEMTMENGPLGP